MNRIPRTSRPKLSLIIPFYNEEENVRKVVIDLRRALRAKVNCELVLVDNGSSDRTGKILAQLASRYENIKVVTVKVNQGYGWGVLRGLSKARGSIIGYMDGDGQIPGMEALRCYRMLIKDGLDICKIARVIRIEPLIRRLNTYFYNLIFRLLFRLPYRDINGHPKLMRRKVYERLGLLSKDWFIDAEVLLKGHSLGARIGEMPVVSYPRKGGKSWVRPGAVIEFLKNMINFKILKGVKS